MQRFCSLVLIFLVSVPIVSAFSIFSIDVDPDNSAHLDVLNIDGTHTRLASLDFKVPFQGSVTASIEDGLVFVTDGMHLMSLDIRTGKTKAKIALPSGGTLRHVAYDYKHAADGAPGHSLYGLWETSDFNISLVHINKISLAVTRMTNLNVTGHVALASLGLPKREPQWFEPEMKHYAFVVKPAGAHPASGDMLAWFKVGNGGSMMMMNPLLDLAGKPLSVTSFSIDYDGGTEKPIKAHNVFITMDDSKGGSDFGIVHMKGQLQVAYAHTDLISASLSTKTATVDMSNAKFYSVLNSKEQSSQNFLVGFDCITGKQVSSVPLSSTPVALYMNETATS